MDRVISKRSRAREHWVLIGASILLLLFAFSANVAASTCTSEPDDAEYAWVDSKDGSGTEGFTLHTRVKTGKDGLELRRSYIKVAVPAYVDSVILHMTAKDGHPKPAGTTADVCAVSDSWSAGSITWGSAPGFGAFLGTLSPPTSGTDSVDVTGGVVNGVLSVGVRISDEGSSEELHIDWISGYIEFIYDCSRSVTITPSTATNEVGQQHTFYITAVAAGPVPSGWNLASYTVSPSPASQSVTGPIVAPGGMSATWELTINHYEPETFQASATVEIDSGSTTATVSTDGTGGSSSPAEKTYIAARITLDPLEAYNGIGDGHTVTATVEVDRGSGYVAESGIDVTFSLPTNNAGATFVGGTSDTTDGSGEASTTITASGPGLVKIHASADIFGDGTYVVTSGSGGENSADAAKTYIKAKIELAPTPEDDAINKVGQQHTIVATVSVTENGSTWTPVSGATVTLAIASDGTGSASLNPLSGTTNGSGQFSSQLVANNPGIVRVSGSATIGSYKGLIIAKPVTVSTLDGFPNSENAKKTYIAARITLDPLEAYNGIGDNHTVTATVEVNDGTGWDAKSGVTVTFSLPTNNAGATFVGGTSDTTDGLGKASTTITASAPGLVKIHASADIFGDGTYVVTSGSGGENSADAAKTYIKAKIELAPTPEDDAINKVGQQHTIVATVSVTENGSTWTPVSGATVTLAIASDGTGSASLNPLSGTTNGSGQFSSQLVANNPGIVRVSGSATIGSYKGLIIAKPVTVSTLDGFPNSENAKKTYIAARITLDPLEAYNGIGDNHTVTATVEVNDGTGWDAKSGVTVTFSLPTNNAGATFVGGTSDTTDGSGEASTTITASGPGLVKIHASADIFGDGTYVVTSGSGGENSADAAKTYIKAKIELAPTPEDDAINKVGQQHTIVATVSVTENGSTWTPVSGATVTLAIASDGTGSASLNPLSGTTNGSGQFSSQLVANNPGIVRVSGSATIGSYKGLIIAKPVTVSTLDGFPNSENAKKTYIAARITLDPLEAYNGIGDNHTVTATVEVNDGTGWDAKSGVTVTFSLPTNNAGATFVGGTSDTTDGLGKASTTITASGPGLVKIHASADIFGDGTYVVTSGSGGENSADAAKTYIKAKIELAPTPEDDAINKVGQQHTIVATVSVTENGSTWTPVSGATVTLAIASDGTGSASLNPLSGTTNGSGQFSSQLVANNPGIVRVSGSATIGSYKGLIIAKPVTVSTLDGFPNSENAKKTYIAARITLDPLEAYNGIGDNHTVTATVEVNDGTGWDAKSGVTVTFSLPTNNAGATFVGGTSDTTDGLGKASTTITASGPGLVKIHASADIFGDGTYVVTSGSGGENSADAAKTYIKAKIELAPTPEDDAINKVGQQHTIVATVSVTENGSTWTPVSGATVTLAIASDGTGSASLNPLSGTTNGSGQFSSQLVANNPGIVRVSGSATIGSYKGLIIAKPVTVSTLDGFPNSENAKKTYIAARITLDPLEAYNGIGDNHTVTATVEVNDGTGWDAKSGVTVTFSLPTNNAGATFVGGTSDTTDGLGKASTTITASGPGLVKIHASADIFGDGTYVVTSGSGGENSADAAKTYIKAKIELAPTPEDDAINKVGQQHTIVATVSVTENGSTWTPVSGATVTLAIASDGTGSASLNPLSGTTNGSGQFSSQLVANNPGIVRVSGSATIGSYKGLIIAKPVTVSTLDGFPNSENAKKTYIAARITLDPLEAYNGIGDNHTVTATVEVNDGTGWDAKSGVTVTFSLPTNNAGATFVGGTSDTTDGLGKASTTITASGPGLVKIHASADIFGDGTYVVTSGSGGENSADAAKTYIKAKIELAPTPEDDAINKVGQQHTIVATVSVTENGSTWTPVSGATVTLAIASDGTGSASLNPLSGTTNGSGQFSSQLVANNPGIVRVSGSATIGSYKGLIIAKPVTVSTLDGFPNSENAKKTYIAARITLDPLEAYNGIGDNHTVTATVEVNDGTGWDAKSGVTVTFSLPTNNAGATFVGGTSDTTDGLGKASTTITASGPGLVKIHASADIFGDGTYVVTSGSGGENSADAAKTYIKAKIELAPTPEDDAINKVGQQHTIVATVSVTENGSTWTPVSGATVTLAIASDGTGSASLNPLSGTTNGSGQFSSQLVANNPGIVRVSGSATIGSYKGLIIAKPVTVSTLDGFPNSGPAEKRYVDAKITLTPLTATNEVESPHTFYAVVKVNDGIGWSAVSGAIVYFTLKNNTAGATIVDSDTTTDANGQAWVKINSIAPGSVEIHASTTVTVRGITLTRETDGTGQNSGNAKKIYVTTGIDIEKATNGQDADNAPGPYIPVGNTVTWVYVVTNTGTTPISNVVITDNTSGVNPVLVGGDSNNDGKLDVTEAWTYQAAGTAIADQYQNVGIASGQDSLGNLVSDGDFSHYFGADPGIDIEKHTNDADADDAPGPYITVGQTVTWKYIVTNSGNVTLTNIVVTDSDLGGVGTITSLAPGASQTLTKTGIAVAWQYKNTGTATVIFGQTAYTDRDDSHYFGAGPGIDIEKATNGQDADSAPGPTIAVGDPITWTYVVTNTGNVTLTNILVTDSDLGTVGIITSLAPGASQTLTKTGTAVAGQYENTGTASITYNNTLYQDTDDSHYFGAGPGIDIEKATNGQDADSAPGPSIAVGAQITWTYVVTNTGNVTLTNILVTDSDLGTVGIITSLAPGASQTLTKTGTAVAGQYENTGTASITYNNTLYQDTDDSHYFGAGPGIDIEKATNGQDADSAPGPSIAVGAQITWTYVVTNSGNVTLTNILVTDSDLGTVGIITSLAPGASQTLTKTGTAAAGQYENTGTASITYNNTLYQDTDDSHYFGAGPGIDIEKATNGQDADSAPGPSIAVGAQITWTYVVTNTGNVTLTNILVTDSDLGTVGIITSLAPGASQTLTKTGTAAAGQYENTGTVSVTYNNTLYQDSDDSHYFGAGPGIDIEKATNGQDADSAPGPSIAVGAQITWTYVVTNSGNVTLTNILVTDSDLGTVGIITSLAPGASQTLTKTGTAVAGQYENTGTASITYNNTLYQDTDDSHYFGAGPGIDIEKATNGQDADSAPGPSIAVGAQITWTYVVTNSGNVTLTNIVVTDSDLGTVGTITSLAPGASQTLTKTGTAAAGQYENTGTASVTYNNTLYQDTDDSHYFGAGADLSLTKGVDNAGPDEGDTIVYTITLANGGPNDATGVQVTDALPAGLTYVSDNGAGAYSSATNVWTVSSLTNGASVTLAITATVNAGTAGSTITNTAEVTAADQPDPDSTPNNHDPDEDDQASIELTVQSADLVVDKTVDNPTPNEGDTIVYTITITNDGPSDATGVTLTDLLPVGVTYVSDNGGGAYDSATGVWTVGSIAVGDIAVLEITATVDAGTAGTTITNAAEVTTSDQPDPDDTNNRDTADITVMEGGGGGGSTGEPCEGRVIINEVAWAGTVADSRDEWIELRNLGTIPVDLTGWTLSWRRKQPTTEEEYRWKVVDLSGILLPASTSACELADHDSTASVEFIKRDIDDLSWWVLGKHEDKDESYYTIERRHDETISNEEANLLYDTTEPYEMDLTDLGDVIQLINDRGEVVDTANASHPERTGWPAGNVRTFATMERTDPLGPDTWENWHTNLGIIIRGLDAQEQPLIATADTLNSKKLEELALNAQLVPTKTRAGARFEVGLDLPREDRIALGWPWIRVTRPDLAEAAGGGGAVEAGAGFSFSGRYSGDLYWLGIDTGGLSPGQHNLWVVYGEGKAILVPIIILP